jgi:hypothetical protein
MDMDEFIHVLIGNQLIRMLSGAEESSREPREDD